MKAIYSCCIIDPFLDVALKLQKEKNVEPVYWVGDIRTGDYPMELNAVKEKFPNVVIHGFVEAWKGIFPEEVGNEYMQNYVDIDFLRNLSNEELQALSMMDRIDYDRRSFCYMERERHFIRLYKYWNFIIEKFKPEIVISAVNPHRVFDYVLYIICKQRRIRFISFQWSMAEGRLFALENFSEKNAISSVIDKLYKEALESDALLEHLPVDIRNNYEKVCGLYNDARPRYMAQHDKDNVKSSSMLYLIRRYINTYHPFSNIGNIRKGHTTNTYKNSKYKLEDSHFSFFEWYQLRKKTLKYNAELSDYYKSKSTSVDLSKKFIVYFLHYQPEETTSPNGDIFANQLLCIETLLKNTSEDTLIYVKEHPNQFMSHMQGHTKRLKSFYDDLATYNRVRLVSLDVESYSLIEKSIAVSTVTGTVGWEAACKKKPVIIFGVIWYERMQGILRVYDSESASRIQSFIDCYKYSEKAILAYLKAFSRCSFRAYHYDGYKAITNVSQEESVENLYNAIVSYIPD